jgi:hypothetical protein
MVKCHFCPNTTDDPCEGGWTPYYHDHDDKEVNEPVCPECVKKHLRFCPDTSDYELLPDPDATAQ